MSDAPVNPVIAAWEAAARADALSEAASSSSSTTTPPSSSDAAAAAAVAPSSFSGASSGTSPGTSSDGPINIIKPFATPKILRFLHYSLSQLPSAYTGLDTNRLTLLHFLLNSLDVMNDTRLYDPLKGVEVRGRIVTWILNCLVYEEHNGVKVAGFVGGTFTGDIFNTDDANAVETAGDKCDNKAGAVIHIAATYCALLCLVALDYDISLLPAVAILEGVSILQNSDASADGDYAGSFKSHNLGSESDMRFLYCAVCIDRTLHKVLHKELHKVQPYVGSKYIRPDLIVQYVKKCRTYDGGVSLCPGLESHGGSYFTGLASVAMLGRMGEVFEDCEEIQKAIGWGVMRQCCVGDGVSDNGDDGGDGGDANGAKKSDDPDANAANAAPGGMQGRINKPPDTCYSFWVGGGLSILEKHLSEIGYDQAQPIDTLLESTGVQEFILNCQHPVFGGFGKLVDAPPDVLHTFYSLCYLSMTKPKLGLCEIDVELGVSKRVGDKVRSEKTYADFVEEARERERIVKDEKEMADKEKANAAA
jgi:geranylgeranyl transferase type-1 subunit beta